MLQWSGGMLFILRDSLAIILPSAKPLWWKKKLMFLEIRLYSIILSPVHWSDFSYYQILANKHHEICFLTLTISLEGGLTFTLVLMWNFKQQRNHKLSSTHFYPWIALNCKMNGKKKKIHILKIGYSSGQCGSLANAEVTSSHEEHILSVSFFGFHYYYYY